MGFITPLLDTLLHDVLGKRMDPPSRRELNAPVKPVSPAVAPPAIRSDSRLDARRPPLPEAAAARFSLAAAAEPLATSVSEAKSAQTNLSPAARAIGTLLSDHPAPPSALRPARPLLPQAPLTAHSIGDPPRSEARAEVSGLAKRLESGIRESGLFYESHLKGWYRGRLSLQALRREPQAQLSPVSPPAAPPRVASPQVASPQVASPQVASPQAASPQVAAPQSSAAQTIPPPDSVASSPRLSPAAVPPKVSAPPAPSAPAPSTSSPGPVPASEPVPARSGAPDPVSPGERSLEQARSPLETSEGLQQLVRHQLELLATPVLRWEGDLWTGVFMAMLIQAPAMPREQKDQERGAEGEDGDDATWQSELQLESRELGALHIGFRLSCQQLTLTLRSERPTTLDKLESGRPELVERLEQRGFGNAQVHLALADGGKA